MGYAINCYLNNMMNNRVDTINQEFCTGCKMCADICPTNSITFKVDNEGFWYPYIDETTCTKCGLCFKKCPSLNDISVQNNEPVVYSAWSKSDNTRISSTSGGVFWEIAEDFIRKDGVVIGSCYSKDYKSARHIVASTIDELVGLKGSKYFQSDTQGIYKIGESYLKDGRKVLFCGTPCQNAAFISFLNRKYDNLFCLDFICRSINSPKAFRSYIDWLEKKYESKTIKVQLKNKDKGWNSLSSKVYFENGRISLNDKYTDPWVKGFIAGDLYTRDSCFNCGYRKIPRAVSDITIGDFWGIEGQTEEEMFKGISVVLVNSKKGERLFENIEDRIVYKKMNLDDALPGNPALVKNPIKPLKNHFFEDLDLGMDFNDAVEKNLKLYCNKSIKCMMKKFIEKIINAKVLFFDKQISLFQFIYLNYFCSHIERYGKARILPHRNTIINFGKGSKIILKGKDLELGFNKLKGSKSETHIRLDKNAEWKCNNGGLVFYNTVIEIKKSALFETGFFSANGGSVIIAHKHIFFGEDVMIGRNVIVYDSDFHSICDENHIAVNVPEPVVVQDHVWLTTNIMVQKGVTIGHDSLVAAYTVVNKDIPPHCVFGGESKGKIIKDWVCWDRMECPMK